MKLRGQASATTVIIPFGIILHLPGFDHISPRQRLEHRCATDSRADLQCKSLDAALKRHLRRSGRDGGRQRLCELHDRLVRLADGSPGAKLPSSLAAKRGSDDGRKRPNRNARRPIFGMTLE